MPSAELQRHLTNGFAIDVRKVVRRYPHMARYPVERVERITSYLVGLELDVRRVVEMQPALLAGQVERYEAVVELLRSNGVDVPNAINSNPSILTRRVDTLRHIMAAIAACGHSVADVVDRLPNILRCTPSDVAAMLQLHCRSKAATQDRPASGQSPPSPTSSSRLEAADPRVAVLASLGLDTDRLLRRAPQIVTLSLNKMKDILAYLQGLGVNVPRVVWKTPFVLAYLPETLQRRVQFLAENGLDVVRHVNGCPQVLALDVEGKLRPKLTFVVEEMRRSALELDRAYNLWSCSLEGRLRPRFRYLRSLGLSPGHLSTFSSFSDVRFAARLAGTDLRHYYAWRERNGYPVPPTLLAPTVAPHDLPALPPSVPTTASTVHL